MGDFIAWIVAMILGGFLAVQGADKYWERKTVEHGCAAYDAKTGEWGWR